MGERRWGWGGILFQETNRRHLQKSLKDFRENICNLVQTIDPTWVEVVLPLNPRDDRQRFGDRKPYDTVGWTVNPSLKQSRILAQRYTCRLKRRNRCIVGSGKIVIKFLLKGIFH